MSALVSARIRDGAVTYSLPTLGDSQVFYAAAEEAFPSKMIDAQEFDYLRALGLLALYAIQNGQTASMSQYLGNYATLVALVGLHDEARWPQSISGVEREERRRVVSNSC